MSGLLLIVVVALVLAVVASRAAFLVVGSMIGAVVGSRLLQIIESNEPASHSRPCSSRPPRSSAP